ncbi:hypothetical protein [Labrys neptuniae]
MASLRMAVESSGSIENIVTSYLKYFGPAILAAVVLFGPTIWNIILITFLYYNEKISNIPMNRGNKLEYISQSLIAIQGIILSGYVAGISLSHCRNDAYAYMAAIPLTWSWLLRLPVVSVVISVFLIVITVLQWRRGRPPATLAVLTFMAVLGTANLVILRMLSI